MKDRPILFSAPMVRALLNDSKTQTRRAVKLPHRNPLGKWEVFPWGGPNGGRTRKGQTVPFQNAISHSRTGEIHLCPYGQPGDRLWVRESLFLSQETDLHHYNATGIIGPSVDYEAEPPPSMGLPAKSIPSIHMPRWASRITLEITGVRVERLQDISEEDARAEGITDGGCLNCGNPEPCGCSQPQPDARDAYCNLWGQINGPDSWAANPWVWCVEFKRVQL